MSFLIEKIKVLVTLKIKIIALIFSDTKNMLLKNLVERREKIVILFKHVKE